MKRKEIEEFTIRDRFSTTDMLERIQKIGNEWFEKSIPPKQEED